MEVKQLHKHSELH